MPNTSSSLGRRLLAFLLEIVGFVLLAVSLATVLMAVVEILTRDADLTDVGALIAAWSCILLAGLAAVWVMDRLRDHWGWAALGFGFNRWRYGLLLGGAVAGGVLLTSFGVLWLGGWVQVVRTDFQASALLAWAAFFVVQPLAEEVVMRSFLQNKLDFYFGHGVALWGSALVFGAMHLSNAGFTWLGGLNIVVGGLLMGQLYVMAQHIWAPFAMHAVWNFLQSTVLGFAVSGVETYRWLHLRLDGPDWLTGGAFGLEGSAISIGLLAACCVALWSRSQGRTPMGMARATVVEADDAPTAVIQSPFDDER